MSKFLDTRGNTTLGIGICDRCSTKRPLGELVPDPNSPALRVCRDSCRDQYDPWRLPAREPERINLMHPRPDVPLTVTNDQAQQDFAIDDRGFIAPGQGDIDPDGSY